ncbi:V-set and immunoglobulin domain-containing protein 10 isoform X1 [Tachysurus vachellii]|uniref:V-set and immunoglobulin domain-containing protein 10 isoform X1 n=1 Tax=Tachysurus vachellii TaxID=175792 RepID=UPI00296AB77A|nr:V-set and immunoglobulin domain-containing protein 10 isoform X1 [Tachysurus vachellii]
MKTSGITFLPFLLLYQTALADEEEVTVIRELGENVILQCPDLPFNRTPSLTRWRKSQVVLATHNHSQPESMQHVGHISILSNSSLNIAGLMKIDQAVYMCETEPPFDAHRKVQLLVTEGPKNMVVEVTPATSLANGTWFAVKASTITINCSSTSFPSQNLTWMFEDLARNENQSRAFGNKSCLHIEFTNIQPEDQRNYTCLAQNVLSMKTETRRLELLVYYAPEIHPDCFWHDGSQLDQILFNCSWYGAYPTPTLTILLDSQTDRKPKLNRSQETENFELLLNRSMLYEGQKITCIGQHMALKPGDIKKCTFTLAAPYPMGQPMVAALEGTNITLKCTEYKSLPPAKTIWQRGVKQEPIIPSSKYIVVEEGPNLSLTIVNATKDDQGVYFCWSENVLAAKELEVYLTIRSSSDKSGAMVGVFISILILAAGITVGYFVYTRRDRICLGFRFGRLNDDNADVINLVESDEEDVFHNAVPRLPSLTNGHVSASETTLVEIHHVQSSDHEDNTNDTDLDHYK